MEEGQVNLSDVPIEQLDGVRSQLVQDINQLRGNVAQLTAARQRFNESHRALVTLEDSDKGNPLLVPLTLSLYAPGKLTSPGYVTVDIGTGYFVKKTIPDAKEFVDRKLKFLDENIGEIEKEVMSKRRNLEMVVQTMQSKLGQQAKQVSGK